MSWDDEENIGKAIKLLCKRSWDDDEEIGRSLKFLVQKLGEAFQEQASSTVYLDPAASDKLSNRLEQIGRSLDEMVDNQNKIGSMMLESSAILALQKENTALHVALSAADRKTRALMQYIRDLSSPCIGCKKQAGQAHTAGCSWEVSIDHVLKTPEVTNGSQAQEEHNAE